MDTKSTKSNKLKITKTVAVILAALCFFTAGLGVFLQIRKTIYYTGECVEVTPVFRSNMNYCERLIIPYGEIISCENDSDYEKTSDGKERKANREKVGKSVEKACDYLDNLTGFRVFITDINEYRYQYITEGYVYYFGYEGQLISEEDFNSYEYSIIINGGKEDVTEIEKPVDEQAEKTTVRDTEEHIKETTNVSTEPVTYEDDSYHASVTELNHITEYLKCIYRNCVDYDGDVAYHYNYGERTTEELVEISRKTWQSGYDLPYMEYVISTLDSSVRYAVFYESTGRVFTNCDVKWDDDEKTIRAKLGSTYIESLKDGQYHADVDFGTNVKWNSISEILAKDDMTPILETSEYEYVEKAYFGCDNTAKTSTFDVIGRSCEGYKSSILHPDNTNLMVLTVVSLVLALLCSVFLFVKAGKTADGEIRILFFDRIPFAVNLLVSVAIMSGCGLGIAGIHYFEFKATEELSRYTDEVKVIASVMASHPSEICAVLFSIFSLVLIALVCGIIRGFRNKTIIRYSLTGLFVKAIKKICKLFITIYRNTIKKWYNDFKNFIICDYVYGPGKTARIISVVAVVAVVGIDFLLLVYSRVITNVLGLILTGIILAVVVWIMVCFDKLAKGISQIKSGDFSVEIDTKFMPPFMRTVADNICSLRDGLSNAVNDALKQQTTKTELITNVTHDLKTPLTSIITYVDLLGKTDSPDEKNEYLAIISEKSQKLKKLIDDLVQVSKASGGTMEVHPVPLDLCQFAMQTVGENEDELRENGIELVLKTAETPIYVNCDPQITGRIFENLISNIRKYSMKGTRAFVEVYEGNDTGIIAFKNISATPLDVDPSRLTERFFRADASRTGDGSGLGLSIAENLCKIQNGQFKIIIDGDYFKAYVTLPVIKR